MSLSLSPGAVEPVIAGLLGAIDVDEGPTGEQLAVLGSVASHVWRYQSTDLTQVAPLGPEALVNAVSDPVDRRRFHEVMVMLEACRHPLSAAQVASVERYSDALGIDGPDLALFRTFVERGRDRAGADYSRFLKGNLAEREEPGVVTRALGGSDATGAEPGLARAVGAFADLDQDSLGQAYLAFYRRHGLPLPGEEASDMNHFFVGHDMTHVIAGIEPTAAGEVALSAFQMAMDDNPVNRSALLASLVAHEAGFGSPRTFEAEERTLADVGAAELLGREMDRGGRCTADFSLVDHLALAPLPLAEVRRRFGVGPPEPSDDGHHHWE